MGFQINIAPGLFVVIGYPSHPTQNLTEYMIINKHHHRKFSTQTGIKWITMFCWYLFMKWQTGYHIIWKERDAKLFYIHTHTLAHGTYFTTSALMRLGFCNDKNPMDVIIYNDYIQMYWI